MEKIVKILTQVVSIAGVVMVIASTIEATGQTVLSSLDKKESDEFPTIEDAPPE